MEITSLNRMAGKWQRGVTSVIFFIVALVFLAIAAVTVLTRNDDYVQTTATITNIRVEGFGDDEHHYVTVEYTVNGRVYEAELGEYASSYYVGKQVKISYDPANPAHFQSDSFMFPIILGAIGAVCLIFAVVGFVQSRKYAAAPSPASSGDPFAFAQPDAATADVGEMGEEKFYFCYDRALSQGHLLYDASHRVIYEARSTKFHLFAPSEFEFVNHYTGYRAPHRIGKTVSTSTGLLTEAHFSFDGVNIWEYLGSKGLTVNLQADTPLTLRCTFSLHGNPIATATMCGTHLFEDEPAVNKLADLPAPGFYRIVGSSEHLDEIFLCALAITRTSGHASC